MIYTARDFCQGHGGDCDCIRDEYTACYHIDNDLDLGIRSYCDGTCASAQDAYTDHLEANPSDAPAATTDTVTLELHHCRNRQSHLVTFEGPDAEAWAVAYLSSRLSTHAVHELRTRPFSYQRFPKLAELLYPTCGHGMSADLCEGPEHWMTRDQEMARGW
jgi:hypothetical protein